MENSSWRFLKLFLGALAIWWSMSACTKVQPPELPPLRAFDPAYFSDPSRQHLKIPFIIESQGLLSLKTVGCEFRPGPFPYHSRFGGDTEVVYYKCIDLNKGCIGSNLEEIGHYYIEDPTKGRSYDLFRKDEEKNRGVFDLKNNVVVELLFPADRDIASIEITYADKDRTSQVFDVQEIVMKVFEKTLKNVTR
jgi:hypothetical protein